MNSFRIKPIGKDFIYKALSFMIFLNFLYPSVASAQSAKVKDRITIEVKNESITNVFKKISEASNYTFFYDDSVLKDVNTISISHKNAKVEDILTDLSKKSKLFFSTKDNTITVGKTEALAKLGVTEKKKYTGVVKDAQGEAIIGASITTQNNQVGAVTDVDGYFELDIEPGTVIKISYLGYEAQNVKLLNNTKLDIILKEDNRSLEEVVIVGYGTQKKVNLTGAVSVVTGEELADRPVPNISQMLQGTVPNMNITFGSGYPGASATINIRGVNSISGSAAPLVLIDGVEGDIDRLNPNDVESISVLKDASAAAVYGARAAYGVILITTKQGTPQKTTISYSGSYSFGASTASTDYESRGYYSAAINDLFYSNYSGTPYSRYTEDDYYQLWLRRNDKTEHPDRPWVVVDQRDGRDTYVYYANMDWYNYLYDFKQPSWNHNVNISGGTEKVSYYFSGGFYEKEGIFSNNPDKYKNLNFRSNVKAEILPKLILSSNTKYHSNYYSYPGRSGINSNFNTAVNHALASFLPTNPDGTAVYTTSLVNNNSGLLDGMNALWEYGKHKNEDRKYEFTTTVEASYEIIKNLNVRANYSYSHYNYQTLNRSVNVPYSQYPGEIRTISSGIGLDRLQENQINHWYHATNIYGDYSFKLANSHNFKVMAGFNYETKYLKDMKASGTNLTSEDLNDLNLVTEEKDVSGGQNEYALAGFFGRLNYDYKGKYLFEASGRYDGSSRFRREDRWGFFPSASAGWRLSEESFFEPLKAHVDNVKLRLSYGSLGNQQVGYYDYIQQISRKNLDYAFGEGTKPYYTEASQKNAGDLTWETVSTINLGLDLGFLSNRLTFTGDVYERATKDMLVEGMKLPASYGEDAPKQNIANLKTKGWEISLGWQDSFLLANKAFKYNVNAGLSDYTSKITKYNNPTKILGEFYEGQQLGEIWGYITDGLFKTDEEAANYTVDQSSIDFIVESAQVNPGKHAGDIKFVDLDGDNKISVGHGTADNPGDRKIIGNSLPRYSYSLNLGIQWNGIDMSAFIQGIGRQHWYPDTNATSFWGPYARPYASFIPSDFMSDVWSPTNQNAYFPRPIGYLALGNNRSMGVVNDRYLQNLAYCRLKNLTVGYTLPKEWMQKIRLTKCRFYFSGENLFTLTGLKSKYIDPEQAASDNSYKKGTGTAKIYPWSKTFSFGLDITF